MEQQYIFLILGFILLIGGSEILIRGSVNLASILNVSPFIVGVVIVAGGTSLPELAACLQSIRLNVEDIVIGNIVGSNIANILLIIGAVAIVHPIIGEKNIYQKPDTAFSFVHRIAFHVGKSKEGILKNKSDFVAILSAILFIYCCLNGVITSKEGIFMLVSLGIFIFIIFSNKQKEINNQDEKNLSVWLAIIFLVGGLIGVILGSNLFILGASSIASDFGISETIIGITIVAVGTSLPELTTGLMAAFKRQTDFAIGNILGSNIYNILGILGVSSLLSDLSIPINLTRKIKIEEIGININFNSITYDAWFILIITLLFVYLLRKRARIGRKTGIAFLVTYLIYILSSF